MTNVFLYILALLYLPVFFMLIFIWSTITLPIIVLHATLLNRDYFFVDDGYRFLVNPFGIFNSIRG